MSDDLYHKDLLRIAARASGAGRLTAPDGTASVANPLCGDRITVDLRLDPAGGIAELGHETRACVLCQAAASILAERGIGLDRAGMAALEAKVIAFLGAPPAAEPPDDSATAPFACMAPVVAVPSRRRCVLLPFEAIARAFAAAGNDE